MRWRSTVRSRLGRRLAFGYGLGSRAFTADERVRVSYARPCPGSSTGRAAVLQTAGRRFDPVPGHCACSSTVERRNVAPETTDHPRSGTPSTYSSVRGAARKAVALVVRLHL